MDSGSSGQGGTAVTSPELHQCSVFWAHGGGCQCLISLSPRWHPCWKRFAKDSGTTAVALLGVVFNQFPNIASDLSLRGQRNQAKKRDATLFIKGPLSLPCL